MSLEDVERMQMEMRKDIENELHVRAREFNRILASRLVVPSSLPPARGW